MIAWLLCWLCGHKYDEPVCVGVSPNRIWNLWEQTCKRCGHTQACSPPPPQHFNCRCVQLPYMEFTSANSKFPWSMR